MRAPPISERTELAAAQGGDELAFRRLLRRHERMIEHLAGRYFLPGGDHNDLLQEARIGFSEAVAGYRPGRGAGFTHFAKVCIKRQLATAVTGACREKHKLLSTAIGGEQAERAWSDLRDVADPEGVAVAREQLAAITAAAATFSDHQRAIFAHTLVGTSPSDTARALGLKPKQVDNAKQRVRRKLEKVYAQAA